MRILQTIEGMSSKSGGPSTCTLDLLNGLYDINAGADLLTVSSPDMLGEGRPWLKVLPCDYKTPLGFSKNICRFLTESDYNLYHANALWSYTVHETCKVARQKGRPYVLSPHGMLYPTALAIKRWKKAPMLALWFKQDIQEAACLHVTCLTEMKHCRTFGYKGPIAVIPNAVVIPDGIDDYLRISDGPNCTKKIFGFLGRLHPIKKVENVLYALSRISTDTRKNISFHIMGKYDDRYEQWLKEEVSRLHLEDCVAFVGFVSGREKYERLSKLSALMVPSAQENFGMIVPESLLCGTPVYASHGTPWRELNDCNCGWWQDNTPEAILRVILDVMSMNPSDLKVMGANGKKLVKEKYEQHIVAGMMKRLYEWIVVDKMAKDKQPDFVYCE